MSLVGKSAASISLGGTLAQLTREGFSRDDLVECVERELRRREREYPELVKLGKMNAKTSRTEISLMRNAVEVIRQLPEILPAQTGFKL